jgi:hypothetical protein
VFWGGVSSQAAAEQLISLPADQVPAIDSNCLDLSVSAMLGGWADQGDYSIVSFEVLDSFSQRTNYVAIGPVTPAERGNTTRLLARATQIAVPPGSRIVKVKMFSFRAAGQNNDGYIDDVDVRLVGRNQSVGFAANAPLSVSRSGANVDIFAPAMNPCSYGYWFHEGVLLSAGMQVGGATVIEAGASRLTLSSCPGFGQVFFAGVANGFGSNPFAPQRVESSRVVFPLGGVVFAQQPRSECVLVGQPFSLTAEIAPFSTSFVGLELQWLKDGVAVPGFQSTRLAFQSASLSDAGVYRLRVTTPCGGVAWSDEATVHVRDFAVSASVQDVYLSCEPIRPLVLRHELPPGTPFRWEMHDENGTRTDLRADSRFVGASTPSLSATWLAFEELSRPLVGGSFEQAFGRWEGPRFVCYALVDGCDVAVASGRWIDSTEQPCQPFGASFGVQAGIGYLDVSSLTESGQFSFSGPVNWRTEHLSTSGSGSTSTGFARATFRRDGSISHEEDDGEVIEVEFSTSGEAFVSGDVPGTLLVERGFASTPRLATPVVFVDRPVWAQYGFDGNPPSGQAERYERVVPLRLAPFYQATASTDPLLIPGSPEVRSSFSASVSIRLTLTPPPGTCDSLDLNNDGLFPDDADLLDFLSVLAGGPCSTQACGDIDFNNDGLFPDDTDLLAYLRVLAGGSCE